jgi:carboxyl-terminal processing protease
VDGLSASTSEIFAGGLQDLGRARVFGTPTAGAALPSVIEKLPNGDGFQYAIANYTSEGGKVLEGRGVIPDVVVAPTREALLAGHDPVLEAALSWCNR